MSGITGVVLNWKRPDNVARIVASWRESGLIDEAIVWNNNPDAWLALDGWARVVNTSHNHGLYTRFAAACLSTNECVLIQDDDVIVPTDSIAALRHAWRRDPDVLHGVFGRLPDAFGLYTVRDAPEGEVPIVLTRALLTHRRHAADFFVFAPALASVQRDARPEGNGEDIIFSYAVMRRSGRLNRVHAVPVVELPDPHAINLLDRDDHLAHRTRLMRACQGQLAAEAFAGTPIVTALEHREPLVHTLANAARRGYLALKRRLGAPRGE